MTAFDIHQHLWPEPLIRALEARSEPPRLRASRLELVDEGAFEVDLRDHDPDARLAWLDRDGIDVAVISSPPTLGLPPDLLDAYHEGILDVARGSSRRLVALATDVVLEGFAGTCIAAEALLDLDSLAPLLDELAGSRGFLFVHPGPAARPAHAPAWWSAVVGYTGQMQAAYLAWLAAGVHRWPGLQVVFAILAGGGPFHLERAASRGGDLAATASESELYLDTASYGPRALELCLATVTADRLVYGSDVPVIDSRSTLEAVRGLGPAAEAALCRTNPGRLLERTQ